MKHPEAGLPVEWDVVIDQLRAQTRIGIHNHERVAQPVVIDAVLHCRGQALPEEISECLDYDAFCRMLCAYLDAQTHTDLVEQLAADLLALAFDRFAMLDDAMLTLYKPHAVRSAAQVGVRLRWSRHDFVRRCAHLAAARLAETMESP